MACTLSGGAIIGGVRSPRSWVPVLGWCAATLSSVALASFAMLPVFRTVTPDESALVTVDQVRDSGVSEQLPLPTQPTPAVSQLSEPTATTSSPSPSPSKTGKKSKAPSGKAPSSPAATTTAPKSPAPATTTKDGWTVTTNAAGQESYVKSFRVEGGTTVIRMTENKVELVTATPSDGYQVQTVQNEPDNLAVYFNEPNHSFVIHAVWFNDAPFVEVSEIGG